MIDLNEEQDLKAFLPMVATFAGRSIELRDLQESKAPNSTFVIESGILIELRF